WIPSWKKGGPKPARQPFCSLMEERLLMYLEYHPQVVWYGRGDISSTFASTYNITTPPTTPTTCLTRMPMYTCLMPSANFRMAPCSVQRQGWSKKSVGHATRPRRRRRAKWPVLKVECIGSELKRPYTKSAMPIWSSYMPGDNLFRPFPNW